MRKPSRRATIIGTAVAGATVALGIGGVAVAAGNDPANPGYAVVEDSPGPAAADPSRDCPDKQGGRTDQGTQETPSQTDPQGQA